MSTISKRKRFEIFKRDGFRCIYCGRTPPEVLLSPDHVIPKSKGGSDDESNIVTSCRDCNSGKSDVPLTQLPRGHEQTLADRQEKLDQLKAITELSIAQAKAEEEALDVISNHWARLDGMDPDEVQINGELEKAARRFLKRLPVYEVIEALDAAYNNLASKSSHSKFKYFCGTCWKKIRTHEEISKPKGRSAYLPGRRAAGKDTDSCGTTAAG